MAQPLQLVWPFRGYSLHEEAIKRGELVREEFRGNIVGLLSTKGDNIQHIRGADSTTSESHTAANIHARGSLFKHLKFLKGLPGCENIVIEDMRTEIGIRETYRIDGLYQVTHEDYVTGKVFDDSLSYSYYPIDLHIIEHGVTPKQLGDGVVATIPLRALIPKKSKNFMVAGRCLSSDRLANSALRVQASSMGMGQVAGATAAIACQRNVSPADVPLDEVKNLLRNHGAIVPKAKS